MPGRTVLACGVLFLSWDIAPLGPFSVYVHEDGPLAGRRRIPAGPGDSRMTLIADKRDCTEQLARFFPKLPAVRIPVRVMTLRSGVVRLPEATVVEFGSEECAIFLSTLALEFDDRVRMARDGGGRAAEAAVIALQYHEGRKAVAVRFLDRPCEWMVCP
jgi:hypothetical protein